MLWANRIFEQEWRDQITWGAQPAQHSDDTQKYVILLTDDEIVMTDPDQDGFRGIPSNLRTKDKIQSLEDFKEQCERLGQKQNMNIYTIGFTSSGRLPETTRDALEDCISGTGKYYEANVADIEGVFRDIQNSIPLFYLKR